MNRKQKREARQARREAEQQQGGSASPDRWVNVSELAERLGVVERTIRNWGKSGRLPLQRMGGHPDNPLGMPESEFTRWLRGPSEPA